MDDPFLRHTFLLFIVTFFIVLPIPCHKLRYSVYYQRAANVKYAQEELRKENDERLRQANQYLKMLTDSKLHSMLEKGRVNESEPDIAVTVISVSRNRHKVDSYEPRYLTQVVWKLLSLLHLEQSRGFNHRVKLSVCNVDPDPDSYREAQHLSSVITIFNRFHKVSLPIIHILEKEKQDYVYCLNSSLQSSPRYVLLIEDDALPIDDFFSVLDHALYMHLDWKKEGERYAQNTEDVTYVKLYHPERLLGYINLEPDRLTELFAIGFFFGTIVAVLYSKFIQNDEKSGYFWRVWFVFFSYFVLVAMAIGRAHLVDYRRLFSPYLYTYVKAPECCTPAMLFPQNGARKVVDYLSRTTCGKRFGKDMALEKFKLESHLRTYMIQPNLVTHIGMYSSLRSNILDPFVV